MRPSVLAAVALGMAFVLLVPTAVAAVPLETHDGCRTSTERTVEDGDPTARYARTCSDGAVLAGPDGASLASATLTHSWERTSYRAPGNEYEGGYTTDRYALVVQTPVAPLSATVATEDGATVFREAGAVAWRETRVTAEAAGHSEHAVLFILEHPGGARCGVAFTDPASGAQHGAAVPLSGACGLVP